MTNPPLLFSAVLLAATALTTSARAFDTTRDHRVFVKNGYQSVPVGKLRCTLDDFVADSEVLGGAEACSYFCQWVSGSFLPSTANLHFDELMTPGRADCEENSVTSIPTIIGLSSVRGMVNKGFDKFGMKRIVSTLIMGEDGDSGKMNGVILYAAVGASVPYGIETIPEPSLAEDDPISALLGWEGLGAVIDSGVALDTLAGSPQ